MLKKNLLKTKKTSFNYKKKNQSNIYTKRRIKVVSRSFKAMTIVS